MESAQEETIYHGKSLLSIQTYKGCYIGCAYCFRKEKSETKPRRVISDEELFKSLLRHPLFVRNGSFLSINSSDTDPFLEEVVNSTFNLLDMMEKKGLRNRVSLVTKKGTSDENIARLGKYRNIDLDLCITYSDMPREIEHYSNEARIDFLLRLKDSGINHLVFYRPIAVGWNDSRESIRKVLSVAQRSGTQGIVVGGLMLSRSIRQLILDNGLDVPYRETEDIKKYLPGKFIEDLFSVYDELGLDIPLFRRTSCGRSFLRGIPDYNGHFSHPEVNCWTTCPPYQKRVCADKKAPKPEEIIALLSLMNAKEVAFDINTDRTVDFYRDFSFGETSLLRTNLGVAVRTKNKESFDSDKKY